jgi:trafficking protein particle complex subunit 4
MSFLHLFIVNKSGGLIHHRPLTEKGGTVVQIGGTNEWLRLASTFHSLHAIAAEASPVRLAGGKNACEYQICIFVVQYIRHCLEYST